MIIVGLTGSIGMGKTTTAALFADEGVPVNDADQVVHDLYRSDAVEPIRAMFPDVIVDGVVDRKKLSENLAKNPAKFADLEAVVHPLVRAREKAFLDEQRALGKKVVVLDIPLLFETGADRRVDKIVVVSCEPDMQRQRVLSRPGMTPEKFELILSRQTPDAEKRARADYVIDTGHGIDMARSQVKTLLKELGEQAERAKHA
ncbi:dephospho-CoA kinase [Rhizobium rosettiformans]|uniref:dephospho-CoA kinase n=1 Tax=Rhizobium rosettiformans TaxID=1368430 RepID=UPI002860F952|nr:dephospho-CoA kinase [Rhizobium rosettiformans]MDR7030024.1 dephospho-CoA kinase [Rhizobium rosettiformans]MDR7065995.1 dephospho-CoA kinase [Rhizobium rosettiformans]